MSFDRWPRVAAAVEAARPVNLMRTPTTIVVDGIHLASAYDRVREAMQQASQVPMEAEECWVYGLGMGDIVPMLLMREPMKRVNVVLMNAGITKSLTRVLKPWRWLTDPRVELHMAADVDVRGPAVVLPPLLQLAEESAWDLRDRLAAELNAQFNENVLAARYKQELAQYEENEREFESVSASCLFTSYKYPVPFAVIAGGPTASESIEWLRQFDDNSGFTLCASTALRSMLANDIVPDYVVLADPSPKMVEHIPEDDRLTDSTLIYLRSCHPGVLRAWPGARYKAFIHGTNPEADLWTGGSVLHVCCDLAVKMGSGAITLVGADLCYPNGASHVEGAPNPYDTGGAWRPRTINGLGETVPTDVNLSQYRRALEDYVARHPEIKWTKRGRAGVPLKGVEWET